MADTWVGVVGLLGSDDFPARLELARRPKCLEVGHGAAAAQMAQVCLPAEHAGNFGHGFLFHAELARPPSKAWLFGLIHMASA